jgi:hypothetical protein
MSDAKSDPTLRPETDAELRARIEALLLRKDRMGREAVVKALLALYSKQTSDERGSEEVHHDNGEGFTVHDARMGTRHVQWYLKVERENKQSGRNDGKGFMTPRMIAYWQDPPAKDPSKQPRIQKYVGQLARIAREKGKVRLVPKTPRKKAAPADAAQPEMTL